MASINSLLDEISIARGDSVGFNESFSDPTTRIAYFDSLLVLSEERINVLEKKVENTKSDVESSLLRTVINDLRQTLEEKERMIIELSTENTNLKSQNLQLSDSLLDEAQIHEQLNREINEQENKLKELRADYEEDQRRLKNERSRLEQDLEKTKSTGDAERAESYFNIAKELLEQYDSNSSGILQPGKRKMKQDMLKSAYTYFRKACELGHSEAPRYIRKLLTDKEYLKDLSIDQSAASITKCGI